jgi:glycosyltransferase involved in cell wall biosynthesis
VAYAWDIPLLEGYQYYFLRNYSLSESVSGFWGGVNPAILKELWTGRYDAVLLTGWYYASSILAFFGGWLTHTPIFIYGDSVSIQRRPWWIRAIKRIVLTGLFRTFSAFLISGTFNREFYAQYDVPVSKMFPFPWAIDNEYFFQQAARGRRQRAETRRQFGIPVDKPIIVFSGKLIPRKRPLDLLQAFEKLGSDAVLLYVGEGELREELEHYVQEHNIFGVQFIGFVNQSHIPLVLSACDIFCLPSAHDPRGTVVNEAMACGLPVVVSEGVGVWGEEDIVRPGENGFVHKIGDIQALANYLHRLLSDEKLRLQMGQRSQAIIEKWGYEECLDGLLNALHHV